MSAYILNTGFFMTKEGSLFNVVFRIGMGSQYLVMTYLIIKTVVYNYSMLKKNEKFAQNQLQELEEDQYSESSGFENNLHNDPLYSRIKDVEDCMRVKRRLLCVYYVCTQFILIFQFFNNFGKLSSLDLYDFFILKQIFVGFFVTILVFVSRLKPKLNPYYGETVFEFRNQRLHQPVRISNIIKYRKLRLNDENVHNSS